MFIIIRLSYRVHYYQNTITCNLIWFLSQSSEKNISFEDEFQKERIQRFKDFDSNTVPWKSYCGLQRLWGSECISDMFNAPSKLNLARQNSLHRETTFESIDSILFSFIPFQARFHSYLHWPSLLLPCEISEPHSDPLFYYELLCHCGTVTAVAYCCAFIHQFSWYACFGG